MDQSVRNKLAEYFSTCAVKTYKKGAIITHAHQEPDGVSYLLEGAVEQYDITSSGNRITVNIFRPPAFFPMSWAINGTPNSYFYAAVGDVKLRQADAGQTVAFLQANPDVMFNLLSRVYRGTDVLLQRLTVATQGVAVNRLIFALLIDAYRFGQRTDDATWLITIQHQALAARSGLARETVSRELHKLEKDKLISLRKDGITLHVPGLEERLSVNT